MSYQIVQADLVVDKAKILAFWSDNHPKSLVEKYTWMYENNPFGRAQVWLLVSDESAEIVGMGAIFPRQFVMNGHCYKAGVLGDFLVHKAHRSLGPALQLQKSILNVLNDNELALLCGLPNQKAELIMRRAGYVKLGTMMRIVKVIRSESFLARFKIPKFLRRTAASVLDLALKAIAIETWRSNKKFIVHEDYSIFDDRFDALWDKKEKTYKNTFKRSAAYMKWKFQDDPDDTNYIYALSTRDANELVGCVVYRYCGDAIEIREFIAADGDQAGDDLMALFLQKARAANPISVYINVLDKTVLSHWLKRFNFWRGSAGRNVYYGAGSQLQGGAEQIAQQKNWLLMVSDEDS